MRSSAIGGPIVVGLLVSGLLACARTPDGTTPRAASSGEPHRTLLAAEPEASLAIAALADGVEAVDLGPWQPAQDDTQWQRDGEDIVLLESTFGIGLAQKKRRDTKRFDVLVVETGSDREVDVSLWLRRDGQPHALWPNEVSGPFDRREHRFELLTTAVWDGSIDGLTVRVRKAESERVRIAPIRGYRYTSDSDRLAQAAEGHWWVDIEGDRRPARVLTPGHPARVQTRLPAHPRLQFALGAASRLQGSCAFRIRLETREDAVLIHEQRLEGPEARRWQPVSLDLDAWAEATVDMIAEIACDGDGRPLERVIAWSQPTIIDRSFVASRPNIVLISVDTLRADALPPHSSETRAVADSTPKVTAEVTAIESATEIAAWARDHAARFTVAVAPAPWTLPSHTTMLTGVGVIEHGINGPFQQAPEALETLAERLRAQGYATAGVTAGGWLDPRYGLHQGFDRYRYGRDWTTPEGEIESIVAQAETWSQALPEPYFLFVHTYAVHDYSDLLPEDGELSAPGTRAELYREAVRLVDARLGPWLRTLSARGDTAVVLTSDHGEALGERGLTGHGALDDSVLLVPLLVAPPSKFSAGSGTEDPHVSIQVRTEDVAPTVASLAGLAPAFGAHRGVSLMPIVARAQAGDADQARTPLDPPRLAASFYYRAGHGVQLRDDQRWRFTFDDDARSSKRPRTHLMALGTPASGTQSSGTPSSGTQSSGTPASNSEADRAMKRLRGAAERLLARRPRFATLRLHNETSEVRVLQLTDSAASTARLASVPAGDTQVVAEDDDGLRLTLPPAAEVRFHLFDAPTLTLRVRDDRGATLRLLRADLATPSRHHLGGSNPGAANPGVVVAVEPGHGLARVISEAEGRLRQRLRDLGYVD